VPVSLQVNKSTGQRVNDLGPFLDDLIATYHRPERIGLDPLSFPRRYAATPDREVVALLAALLAWGRVQQIANVLERLLTRLGPDPCRVLAESSPRELLRLTRGIVHRTATSADLAAALNRVGEVLREFGTLQNLFVRGHDAGERTVIPALTRFAERLRGDSGARGASRGVQHLFPRPELGSACKRWLLFLRWVVRPDDGVDLGLWTTVRPDQLVIPLDTHMHRIALNLGLTRRRDASLRTALEVTEALRAWRPDDPVACDFSLTRLGILQLCPTLVDPVICAACGLRTACRHGLGL
jgi:uncharacterized protein (TIGR02757 family)